MAEYRPYTVSSPAVTKPKVDLYGRTYTLASLDTDELDVYNSQFPLLLAGPDSVERKIQLERQDVYMMGMRAIKHALKAPAFRGLNPGDTELGFGRIRPQFTENGVHPSYKTTWTTGLLAAVTWTDFLFRAVDTGYACGEDFGLIVTHVMSLTTPTPFVTEIHCKVGRIDLIPSGIRPLRVGDNENGVAIFPVPTMYVLPKEDFWEEIYSDAGGTDELLQGGLVVGLGRILKETTPTWA